MSEARKIATSAEECIEELLSDMFESNAPNNHILLGTLGTNKKPIQVQLIVTREPSEFFDEM